MNRQIWIIFLLITNITAVLSQINEGFYDIGLGSDWIGDRDHFLIEGGELRLNAAEMGSSELWTPILWLNQQAWQIDIRLDFDPSNTNQLLLYLYTSDTTTHPGQALYLLLGESGSDDAIHLFQQSDTSTTLLASGSMGLVAEEPELSLTAKWEAGFLSISALEMSQGYFEDDITVALDNWNPLQQGFFGWKCNYTSSRANRFYFDNIYVGPVIIDSSATEIVSFEWDSEQFHILWSETIQDMFDLQITPPVSDLVINHNSNEIIISGNFETGIQYRFELNNILDLFNNVTDTMLTYTIARAPNQGDILINEILFNPRGSGSDYVELINITDQALSLANMAFLNKQSGNQENIKIDEISAQGILLFTEDIQGTTLDYPTHNADVMIQQDLPAWNNDAGNVTLILNGQITIDEMNYDEDQHLTIIDDEEGVSLERISLRGVSGDADNWTSAATIVGYGTPGRPNSNRFSGTLDNVNFNLENKIISPNGDGHAEELIIHYVLDQPNYVATISIFSDAGQLRHYIIRNETLATEGQITWDLRTADSQRLNKGIYIAHISIFNLTGEKHIEKLSFGITDPGL